MKITATITDKVVITIESEPDDGTPVGRDNVSKVCACIERVSSNIQTFLSSHSEPVRFPQ